MPGFRFERRLGGGVPTIEVLKVSAAESVAEGDFVHRIGRRVRPGRTGDGDLLGVAQEAVRTTNGVRVARVIVDDDAVYAVVDAAPRSAGDTLDLNGSSGAHGVAIGPNADFVAVAASANGEVTLVRINPDAPGRRDSTDGQIGAAITRAVVRVHRSHVGRGPVRAQTFIRDSVVVVLMHEVMTTAERSLVARGKDDIVLAMRQQFQRTMRDELVAVVEKITACKVVAFMSDNHVDPDMAAELFVLDRPLARS